MRNTTTVIEIIPSNVRKVVPEEIGRSKIGDKSYFNVQQFWGEVLGNAKGCGKFN